MVTAVRRPNVQPSTSQQTRCTRQHRSGSGWRGDYETQSRSRVLAPRARRGPRTRISGSIERATSGAARPMCVPQPRQSRSQGGERGGPGPELGRDGECAPPAHSPTSREPRWGRSGPKGHARRRLGRTGQMRRASWEHGWLEQINTAVLVLRYRALIASAAAVRRRRRPVLPRHVVHSFHTQTLTRPPPSTATDTNTDTNTTTATPKFSRILTLTATRATYGSVCHSP